MKQRSKFTLAAGLSVVIIAAVLLLSFFPLPRSLSIYDGGVTVNAASGSAADIQAAVNQAAANGKGTVQVPAGTAIWHGETVNIPTGVNVIGASLAGCQGHEANWTRYTATTILHNDAVSTMFFVTGKGQTNKASRISGIQFEFDAATQSPGGNGEGGAGIILDRAVDSRVDHCTFINCGQVAVFLDNTDLDQTIKGRAVIDHCIADYPYKSTGNYIWGYGFYVRGSITATSWDTWTAAKWADARSIFGKYDTGPPQIPIMYVEDCHTIQARHAVDCIQGGFYCARYNLFEKPIPKNYGIIDIHGTESETGMTLPSYIGGRGCEAYGNTVVGQLGNYNNVGMMSRGGSSLVFNNKFINDFNSQYNVFDAISNDDGANLFPGTHVNQTYLWGNTITGGVLYGSSGGYTENVDFFLRAPTQAQDGFTYTSYPYPHPLVGAGELPPAYTVTIQSSVNGTTSPPSGTLVYSSGSTMVLTATPNSGYKFDYWLINGQQNLANPASVNITSNVNVTPVFTLKAENPPPPPPPPPPASSPWWQPIVDGWNSFWSFSWFWNWVNGT